MEDQQASAFPRTMSVVVTVRSAAAHRPRMITPELKAVLGPLADSMPRAAMVVVSGLLAIALADAALAFVARLDQGIARRMVQFNWWAIMGIAAAVPTLCGASLLGGWWWGYHSDTNPLKESPIRGCRSSRSGVDQRRTSSMPWHRHGQSRRMSSRPAHRTCCRARIPRRSPLG
jgi:hypothetical protein